ncbi:MAG: PIN domain-containing protein [Thermodesulfovibrionales bacterium]|nr:PIN domain-containing protein [Thermodesulfovibrionales bacterium]
MQASIPLKRLAADANVILSAVAGKAALRVFLKEDIEIITTQFNIDEVRQYLSVIAEQYSLREELLESQLKLLPLKIYSQHFYEGFLKEASKRLAGRDEDDIELLALAIKLHIPVWSNDGDFKNSGVEVYTTARLLKILKI